MTMQVIDPLGLTVVGPCGEREDIDIDQLLKWLRHLKDAYKEWKDRKDPLGTFTEEDWQRIFGRFWRLILQHMNADTRQHFLDAITTSHKELQQLVDHLYTEFETFKDFADALEHLYGNNIISDEMMRRFEDVFHNKELADKTIHTLKQLIQASTLLDTFLSDPDTVSAGDLADALSTVLAIGADIAGDKSGILSALGGLNPFTAIFTYYAEAVRAIAANMKTIEKNLGDVNSQALGLGLPILYPGAPLGDRWRGP
jgi:hypothetical protein